MRDLSPNSTVCLGDDAAQNDRNDVTSPGRRPKDTTTTTTTTEAEAIHNSRKNDNDDDGDIWKFIKELPKVELHVHLDGSFDWNQLWKHLQDNDHLLQCLPVQKHLPWLDQSDPPMKLRSLVAACKTEDDFRDLCICTKERRPNKNKQSASTQETNADIQDAKTDDNSNDKPSLLQMLECFEVFLPLVNDNFELLEKLAHAFVRKQKEQNVVYTEVRYSPHTFSATDARGAHAAITRGLRKGCAAHDVTVNQILCAINFRPEWSQEVVEMAHELRHDSPCAVVGVDVAAGEDHFHPNSPIHKGHFDMCRRAKELDINITIHAGETPGSAENVCKAVERYGAQRIGHGYQIADQPELLQRIRQQQPSQVHFEICPTSSVQTGAWDESDQWINHPATELRDAGFPLSISSDDPSVFDTTLESQYHIAAKEMKWSRDDILQSVRHAIDAAFIPEDEKDRLRRMVAMPASG